MAEQTADGEAGRCGRACLRQKITERCIQRELSLLDQPQDQKTGRKLGGGIQRKQAVLANGIAFRIGAERHDGGLAGIRPGDGQNRAGNPKPRAAIGRDQMRQKRLQRRQVRRYARTIAHNPH